MRFRPTLLFCALALGLSGLASAAQKSKDDAEPAPTRDQFRTSQNNLRQLGIAMHAGHDVGQAFPNNIKGRDGKALLSWRVAILPYLEQDNLFKSFKLDEAWDSE